MDTGTDTRGKLSKTKTEQQVARQYPVGRASITKPGLAKAQETGIITSVVEAYRKLMSRGKKTKPAVIQGRN
jgi:hypothetical protein